VFKTTGCIVTTICACERLSVALRTLEPQSTFAHKKQNKKTV
jgi:hypothetical protein